MNKAVIFCPSEQLNTAQISLSGKYLYIAADSGIETAEKFGIIPDIVIGDLDSCNPDCIPPQCKIIRHPAEKDDTDLMLAIKYALTHGYTDISVIGGIDGRLDHTLANLLYMGYVHENGGKLTFDNGYTKVSFLKDNNMTVYKGYKYISVIPLTDLKGLTLCGFKYPLVNAYVSMNQPYTVSNELPPDSDDGTIGIADGSLLVVETLQ